MSIEKLKQTYGKCDWMNKTHSRCMECPLKSICDEFKEYMKEYADDYYKRMSKLPESEQAGEPKAMQNMFKTLE